MIVNRRLDTGSEFRQEGPRVASDNQLQKLKLTIWHSCPSARGELPFFLEGVPS